jgi:Fe-S cluster assembly protein SufD
MNSLTQYITLYEENRAMINAKSPEALNAHRDEALSLVKTSRLPRRGDEGFEMTDLESMFSADLGVNINRVNFTADVARAFKCDVPNISTLLGVVANDVFTASEALKTRLPEGVRVLSMAEAAKVCPEVIAKHYGTIVDKTNVAAALNTLLVQDGIVIYVPRGVECEKPIQIVNILNAGQPMLALRRVLIVLDEGARCRVLTCDHAPTSAENTSLGVVEIALARDSSLEWYDIEESSSATSKHNIITANLAANARLKVNTDILTCGKTRNTWRVNLNEPGAECNISGMAFTDANQVADNSATVIHHAPQCTSDQLFKYVVDGESRGAFEGLILVKDGAHHTSAYQNNKNIVVSKTARMHTRPQLEIYCDDVQCSHGAATGQLDERAMFYMRSRGIPEKEARSMLTEAFMADVIETITLDGLNDRMRHLVTKRLSGEMNDTTMCDNCNVC